MFKPYVLKLALVYFGSRRGKGFINVISFISLIGIWLGITVLITVLSIMNGFQTELRERILGMTAHLSVFEKNNELQDWQNLRKVVLTHEKVKGAAPNIVQQALVTHGQVVKGVMVRGVDPSLELEVTRLREYLREEELAELQPGRFKVILGAQLAQELGAYAGSKVTLVVPQAGTGIVGSLPRLRRFEVAGLVDVGMHEYDSGMLLINIKDAAKLYKFGDRVNNLQLQLVDLFEADTVLGELGSMLESDRYFATTWKQQHSNFFEALALEKRIMFIIIFLIIAVATFNIVSTMVMVVNEKQSAIAILRTQGASRGEIVQLFFLQGALIGVIGSTLGVFSGIVVAWQIDTIVPFLEALLGIRFFPPEVYYISVVPSELQWGDVITVAGVAFASSVLATIYPAWRASKIQPSEVLRHE